MKWCDLSCEYASFPKEEAVDGAGSCRTFQAIHCARLNQLVHKNGRCRCPELNGSRPEDHGRDPGPLRKKPAAGDPV